MTLRVTRQFGEVLGTDGGTIRAARQYVEVLGGGAAIHSASVTSTLALAGEQTNFLADSDSFLLESELNLTQGVVTSGLLQAVASAMSITQIVNVLAPNYQYLASPMHISSEVFRSFEKTMAMSNVLEVVNIVGRAHDCVVSSSLVVVQAGWRSGTALSTMNIAQGLDWGKHRWLEPSILDLDQTLLLNAIWSRPVSQDLGLGHSLTYYAPISCGSKDYAPYTGESTITTNPTPPPANVPIVQGLPSDERFQFQYPGIGEAVDTVELRAPNLDNRERLAFNRINRETRGGRLIVFADPTWPQVNTLVLSFSGLKKTEVDSLQDFLQNHLGKEVGLIDWEGRQWVGLITSPTASAVQDSGRPGSCGSFTINLEFEGVMLEEMPSGSHLTVLSTVVAVLN